MSEGKRFSRRRPRLEAADDESLFLEAMERLKVTPAKGPRQVRGKKSPAPAPTLSLPEASEEDRQLFLAEMGRLEAGDLAPRLESPEPPPLAEAGSDSAPSPSSGEPAPPTVSEEDRRLFALAVDELSDPPNKDAPPAEPVVARPRRLRPPASKSFEVEERLDLHGLRGDEAIERLGYFVERSAAAGLRSVLVITGKGLHSKASGGVLRQRVEGWLKRHGHPRVRAYSEAPRSAGGRGAFVFYLGQG